MKKDQLVGASRLVNFRQFAAWRVHPDRGKAWLIRVESVNSRECRTQCFQLGYGYELFPVPCVFLTPCIVFNPVQSRLIYDVIAISFGRPFFMDYFVQVKIKMMSIIITLTFNFLHNIYDNRS